MKQGIQVEVIATGVKGVVSTVSKAAHRSPYYIIRLPDGSMSTHTKQQLRKV